MSRPEIAIHKKRSLCQNREVYEKRSQQDYSLSLKLQIIREIEQGKLWTTDAQQKYVIQSRSTLVNWLRKHGSFDWENQTPSNMPKSQEQKIMEL